VTFAVGSAGRPRSREDRTRIEYSRNTRIVFEFALDKKVLKEVVAEAQDGGTVGLVVPAYRLAGGKKPDDAAFLAELTDLLAYARRREQFAAGLPWASWPKPRKFTILTNVGGYGEGSGYGIRHSDHRILEAELNALHHMGLNGLRGVPDFVLRQMADGKEPGRHFTRAYLEHFPGYPVPSYRKDRPQQVDPAMGCPSHPSVSQVQQEQIAHAMASVAHLPVDQVWGLTVDEIGAVIDRSPQGKAHLSQDEHCIAAFQAWLQQLGHSPSDFGKAAWDQVKPPDIWARGTDVPRPWRQDAGAALAAYYSRRFNNETSARLFTPLRNACAEANAKKKQALAAGAKDGDDATRPWVYSFALRGNTFLMGGHSLDFFTFYRHADNAMVYETSNRDPRIWSWDSYLCDVGRVLKERLGQEFGIYVKPHRGAPVQRLMTSAARRAIMCYWYTYGPEYFKGDSFSERPELLALVSKGAHLLARAEDVLYQAQLVEAPKVAIVKPLTSEIWMGLDSGPARVAAWENAKWVYTALQHAHVPVDPIDEVMIEEGALSRYQVVYVNGPNITRKAAAALAEWVRDGGIVWTSGGGLARDEANQPLTDLQELLGLQDRQLPQVWYSVNTYGASSLEGFDEKKRILAPVPEGAAVAGGATGGQAYQLAIGREVLKPAAEADVVASHADGSAAIVRHQAGKGQAWTVGFFPGLEYSAGVRQPAYDMSRDFDPRLRQVVAEAALQKAKPLVDASEPLVEGVLMRQPADGREAVVLMSWAYRVAAMRQSGRGLRPSIEHVVFENVTVRIRGLGGQGVPVIKSALADQPVEARRDGDTVVVRLPRLEEADVLLIQ
jgi:hypothetical protein